MYSFTDACLKAKTMFTEKGYLNPLVGAVEVPGKWIFFGKRIEGTDFRNLQIAIDKTTGAAKWYDWASPLNIDETLEAVQIPIPA